MKTTRFTTVKYDEGSSFSVEHCPVMDGAWKYGEDCYEVIFKKKGKALWDLNIEKSSYEK